MAIGHGDEINQHKRMAGNTGSKCDAYPAARTHPDASANTGSKGAMGESERAVGGGVSRGGKELPGQMAPAHGPTHNTNVAWGR